MLLTENTDIAGKKQILIPHFPPKISHRLIQLNPKFSAVRAQGLSAGAVDETTGHI